MPCGPAGISIAKHVTDWCIVYCFFCWGFFPIVYFLYPETANRTLEDMDEIFIQNPGLIVAGKGHLTQRKRPQAFIEAEERRIAEAEETATGKAVLDGKPPVVTTHSEHV